MPELAPVMTTVLPLSRWAIDDDILAWCDAKESPWEKSRADVVRKQRGVLRHRRGMRQETRYIPSDLHGSRAAGHVQDAAVQGAAGDLGGERQSSEREGGAGRGGAAINGGAAVST